MNPPQRTFTTKEQQLFEEVLAHRRDVRGNRFVATPVPEEALQKIIDAGLTAPSVGFSQPWEFVMITDPDVKNEIKNSFVAETNKAIPQFDEARQQEYQQLKLEGITEAPINMAVFYVPKKGPVLGQTSMPDMGRYSVVCAIQNMWLMARALNIGMGWVSIVDPEAVKRAVHAPQTHELIGYLCFGYTDLFYPKPELELRKWERKKAKEDVVIYEKYNK